MDEALESHWQGLSATIDALEAIRRAFGDDQAASIQSVRRIAHALARNPIISIFPEVGELAAPLETASGDEVAWRLDQILGVLRQMTASSTQDKVNILVIDDDRVSLRILLATLAAPDRAIFVASTAAAATKLIEEKTFALVILDVVLGDTDGRALLLQIRERARTATVPIVVVSGLHGTQPKSECYALGADDYFEKPFDRSVFSTVISSRLKRSVEVNRELRRDAVTGLLNRAAFHEAFQHTSRLAARTGEPLSLCIFDIDFFKKINDNYGHPVGDEVLRRVSTTMTRALRQTDLLARWGGDEFVALFPNTREQGAARALFHAFEIIRQETCPAPDGRQVHVTCSAGVVEVVPGETLEESVASADRYLYFAKASGRDRVLTPSDTFSPIRRKILLADDGETLASIVKHILTRERFEVAHVKDGASAIRAASQGGISLLILDVTMPVLDGFEVLKQIRETPALQKMPVLMITATGNRQDIQKAMDLGANDYLLKPFTPHALISRVRRLIV